MGFSPQPHNWVNGTAGLLLGSLGVWVAMVRPRRLSNVAFGIFLALFGFGFLVNHFVAVWDEVPDGWQFITAGLLWGPACAALVVAVLQFPLPLERRLRRWAALAGLGCLATMAIILPALWADSARDGVQDGLLLGYQLGRAAFACLVIFCFGAAAVLALRFAAERDGWQRRRIGLAGLALGIYLGSVTGTGPFTSGTSPLDRNDLALASTAVDTAWTILLVVLWLAATRAGPHARLARNVALAHLVFACLGLLIVASQFQLWGLERAWHGIARLAAFSILAYAILKGRLLGIDRPARFVISSSLLLALLAAVFAVATKVAENLLTDSLGLLVGGVAAGLILLAVKPLERIGRTLAGRAIPSMAPEQESLSIYREQATLAWRDGTMTARERLLLDNLRSRLGVTASDAHRVEGEVLGAHAARPRSAAQAAS